MHQLTKLQLLVYNVGGLLVIIGALLPIFLPDPTPSPYVFSAGALMFGAMQALQRYEGHSFTVRRLRRQQLLGALALVVAGGFMFCSLYGVAPFSGSEWQMAFAIGAVFEVYTAFRIPAALAAEQGKEKQDAA